MLLKDPTGKILVSPNGKPLEVKDNFRSGDSESTSNTKPSASSKADGDVFVYNAGGKYGSGSKAYVVVTRSTTTQGTTYAPLTLSRIAKISGTSEDTIRQMLRDYYELTDFNAVQDVLAGNVSISDAYDAMQSFNVACSIITDIHESETGFLGKSPDAITVAVNGGEIYTVDAVSDSYNPAGKMALVMHGMFMREAGSSDSLAECLDSGMTSSDPILAMYIIGGDDRIEYCNGVPIEEEIKCTTIMYGMNNTQDIIDYMFLVKDNYDAQISADVPLYGNVTFEETFGSDPSIYEAFAQKIMMILFGIHPLYVQQWMDIVAQYGADFVTDFAAAIRDYSIALMPAPVISRNGSVGKYFTFGIASPNETTTTKEWRD